MKESTSVRCVSGTNNLTWFCPHCPTPHFLLALRCVLRTEGEGLKLFLIGIFSCGSLESLYEPTTVHEMFSWFFQALTKKTFFQFNRAT